jgi:uncharacterized oligopeptide transporter (OPT) family protein
MYVGVGVLVGVEVGVAVVVGMLVSVGVGVSVCRSKVYFHTLPPKAPAKRVPSLA